MQKEKRCLRCNLPTSEHTRSMQLVARQEVAPVLGFKMNLYACVAHGGPRIPRSSGLPQQGEGRFVVDTRQMR